MLLTFCFHICIFAYTFCWCDSACVCGSGRETDEEGALYRITVGRRRKRRLGQRGELELTLVSIGARKKLRAM